MLIWILSGSVFWLNLNSSQNLSLCTDLLDSTKTCQADSSSTAKHTEQSQINQVKQRISSATNHVTNETNSPVIPAGLMCAWAIIDDEIKQFPPIDLKNQKRSY